MKSLSGAILLVFFLILCATDARAQVQIGTGAYGGFCVGPNCGEGVPPNVGTGAYGGVCFGPNCGSMDSPNTALIYRPSEPPRSPYQSPPRLNDDEQNR
jgi:hypothetical protein